MQDRAPCRAHHVPAGLGEFHWEGEGLTGDWLVVPHPGPSVPRAPSEAGARDWRRKLRFWGGIW